MNPHYTQSAGEEAPDSLLERAVQAHHAGDAAAARALYERILAADPGHAGALNNLGIALKALGRHGEAMDRFDSVLKIEPAHADARFNLANTLSSLGRHADALPHYEHALAANPCSAGIHNNFGNALMTLGRQSEAVERYLAAIAFEPGNAQLHANYGNALAALGRHTEAIERYDTALAIWPDYAEAHVNRANALQTTGRHAEAAAGYAQALAIQPVFAEAHNNMGSVLGALGRHEEALLHFERALAIDPGLADAQVNQAMALLRMGRYREGWPLYESRWRRRASAPPAASDRPLWLGRESVAGRTLLIQYEQGLGDAILMLRFVPLLEAMGARCLIEMPLALEALVQRSFPRSSVVSRNENPREAEFRIPLMSLPLAMQMQAESGIPAKVPYLAADPAKAARWTERLSCLGKPAVGLAWRGNPRQSDNRNRSIGLEALRPLLETTDLHFVVLHNDLTQAEDTQLSLHANVTFRPANEGSFDDLGALISAVDQVVSVDSSPAHLAGALGKRTRVLLWSDPAWVWQLGRGDSPWYPTVRLLRQKSPGDWSEVMLRLCAALCTDRETR